VSGRDGFEASMFKAKARQMAFEAQAKASK